jgi:hypothetical protein
MRDNDEAECLTLKARLLSLVPTFAAERVKVRLVIQELESWYLGDPEALRTAGLLTAADRDLLTRKALMRNPDAIANAKQVFQKLVGRGR